ncbi:cathepsin B-like cysteine proteinase 3 [Metopolophium dirhodum]|uniref:cathepsin B-like cysteine proteinase 3 n=1 Tax=Metopolophium dirhodum TaxID=44670 RepID=UPI0029906FF9|nr:cathepsin B-like cysteine proteinase 3 [Metopolophium dirhodum]
MAKFVVLISVVLLSVYLTEQAHFLSKDYINKINEVAKTWKAKQNFPENTPKEQIVRLLGSKRLLGIPKSPIKENDKLYMDNSEVPEFFDSRLEWKYCKTIGHVRNQGNCGSCWAHGTTGAFADRLCVATNGEVNELISAEELTFCCHRCGFGCNGGNPLRAWQYFKRHGVVTGGDFNTTDGCQPYRVPPCVRDDEGHNSCSGQPTERNHKCSKKCYGDDKIDYKSNHYKTKDAYYLSNTTMQKDTMVYGPIEASFDVYDDFMNYESGVYQRTENASYLGGHAVKMIGWGVEEGTPYWLMVNSWGEQWGASGMFKIRRGTDECGIESSCTAGVPSV